MIRRLVISIVLTLAATAFAPLLRAQDIALSSISTVQGGLVLNECNFDMENGFNELYFGASATCTVYLEGNQQNQFICGTNGYGDIESQSCPDTMSPLPGDTYEMKASFIVWFAFDDSVGEYDDPFGYLQLPAPIACADSCTIGDYSDEDFSIDFVGANIATTTDSYTTVSIEPVTATVAPGKTVQFSTDDTVNWTLSANTGSPGNFNTETLVYTAPASVSETEVVTVKACNVDNSSDCASADVTVEPVNVAVSPESADVIPGTTQQFTAVVTPSSLSQTVSWSINPTGNGSINTSTGLYTALPPAQVSGSGYSVQVIATSKVDGTTTGTATVTVSPVTVTVNGASPFLATPGATQTLTATVSGTVNNGVAWSLASGGVGSVSQAGVYTAPSPAIQSTQSATVNACLTANMTICGSFTISLVPPVVVTSVVPTTWPAGQVIPVSFTGSGFGTNPIVTLSDPNLAFIPTSPPTTPPTGTVTVATSTKAEVVTVTVTSTSNAINSHSSGNVTVVPATITVAISPTSVQLEETTTQQFTPTVTCKTAGGITCSVPQTLSWTLSPNLGKMSTSNLYTASSPISTQTVVTAKGCATANLLVCATATITLVPINVTVTPTTATLTSGGTQQYTAQVTGAPSNGVTWSISPSVGTISASGLYTAPNPVTAAQTITITAASTVDTTRKGTATASLTLPAPDFTISVAPTSQEASQGGSSNYLATVSDLNGFAGNVSLTMTASPSGPTGTFRLVKIRGGELGQLLVTVPAAIATGNYTLTVTGTSGSLVHSTTASLIVVPPGTPGVFFFAPGSLNTARYKHTATMLNNGTVLLAGGVGNPNNIGLSSAEVYNPATGTFTNTSGSLNTARSNHTATLLNNGLVLLVGGEGNSVQFLASAELYNPATGAFTYTKGNLNTARELPTATLLSNGMVLITGGIGGSPQTVLASAELYDPTAETFTYTSGSLNVGRFYDTASLLNSGEVLIAGGANNGGSILSSAELYNPATRTFSYTPGSMNDARQQHAAVLLNNGEVLVAGGENTAALLTAELYNPATGTFGYTSGDLPGGISNGTATLLNNGQVLLSAAELYNPLTETFAFTAGTLDTERGNFTATLLNNGEVLVAGGFSSAPLSSAELYLPTTLTPAGLLSIALTPANPSVAVGGTEDFIATGTFSGSTTQTLASATWSSSSAAVATVTNDSSNSGHANAVASGTTTIKACAGSICGSTTMTVTP